MTQPSSEKPAWSAHLLRVTSFVQATVGIEGLFEKFGGEPPVTDEIRPRETAPRQAGPFGEGVLEFLSSLGRMYWCYGPGAPCRHRWVDGSRRAVQIRDWIAVAYVRFVRSGGGSETDSIALSPLRRSGMRSSGHLAPPLPLRFKAPGLAAMMRARNVSS
jgi:hypothetical protein